MSICCALTCPVTKSTRSVRCASDSSPVRLGMREVGDVGLLAQIEVDAVVLAHLPAVPHHRREKAEVGHRQRPPEQRQSSSWRRRRDRPWSSTTNSAAVGTRMSTRIARARATARTRPCARSSSTDRPPARWPRRASGTADPCRRRRRSGLQHLRLDHEAEIGRVAAGAGAPVGAQAGEEPAVQVNRGQPERADHAASLGPRSPSHRPAATEAGAYPPPPSPFRRPHTPAHSTHTPIHARMQQEFARGRYSNIRICWYSTMQHYGNSVACLAITVSQVSLGRPAVPPRRSSRRWPTA